MRFFYTYKVPVLLVLLVLTTTLFLGYFYSNNLFNRFQLKETYTEDRVNPDLLQVDYRRRLADNKEVGSLTFKEKFEGRGEEKLSQDEPSLIKYVRQNYILTPSMEPYNLDRPDIRDPAYESESETILNLLEEIGEQRTGGFFIEAGASGGEQASTTLMLERYLNWTGLLVEPVKSNFDIMRTKNRKSWISNAALSANPYPEKITITNRGIRNTTFQTIPLWTLLLAINRTKVDFLSLDVDHLTKKVLYTLPLDKLQIKVAMIEVVLESDEGNEVRQYLEHNGFSFHKYHRTNFYKDNRINDIIMYKTKNI